MQAASPVPAKTARATQYHPKAEDKCMGTEASSGPSKGRQPMRRASFVQCVRMCQSTTLPWPPSPPELLPEVDADDVAAEEDDDDDDVVCPDCKTQKGLYIVEGPSASHGHALYGAATLSPSDTSWPSPCPVCFSPILPLTRPASAATLASLLPILPL